SFYHKRVICHRFESLFPSVVPPIGYSCLAPVVRKIRADPVNIIGQMSELMSKNFQISITMNFSISCDRCVHEKSSNFVSKKKRIVWIGLEKYSHENVSIF